MEENSDNASRDSIERQQKLRALEIKVRDLSQSREKWKQRAIKAEKELRILHANSADGQKKGKKLKNQ